MLTTIPAIAATPAPVAKTATPDTDAQTATTDVPPVVAGVMVSLSAAGQIQAARNVGKNADIDNSSLPDGVKALLKTMRDIQSKIAQKMQEIKQVMANNLLSDKERAARVGNLQIDINTLSNVLTGASHMLAKSENESGMSLESRGLASKLASRDS